MSTRRTTVVAAAFTVLLSTAVAGAAPRKLIPITTRSDEARSLYLEGRNLIDRLQAADANVKTSIRTTPSTASRRS